MKNDSWKTHFKERLKTVDEVNEYFSMNLPKDFPFDINIPLHLAKEIKDSDNQVLRSQFLPTKEEITSIQNKGLEDPIGDQENSKLQGIVHRYQNRILFFPTTNCPVICRYCFRKNELSDHEDYLKGRLGVLKKYLQENSSLNEVILSGGDPLMISNEKIEEILHLIKRFKHIKYVRFHSRSPISMPKRIDDKLIEILTSFVSDFRIILVVHINHASELSDESINAVKKLSPIKMLSQSVLLKGVNNDAFVLKDLFQKLDSLNISPYYLHHPDKVKGAMHFDLSIEEGLKIMKELRQLLPGWLIPRYIQDFSTGKHTLA